jgi:hypothetical protein
MGTWNINFQIGAVDHEAAIEEVNQWTVTPGTVLYSIELMGPASVPPDQLPIVGEDGQMIAPPPATEHKEITDTDGG